ncbi:MAG: zinc-binding dehydrogenase [Candidatus Omnitrophota bacterium]
MNKEYRTAKAVVFEKPEKAVVKDVYLPSIDEKSIVVKTTYSGISSGTEMAVYSGEAAADGISYPCIPGYEEVGEVAYVGSGAFTASGGGKFKVGDRVMANEVRSYPDYFAAWGGQCGIAVKNPVTSPFPMDRPALIPDNVTYQEAVVAYLACVAKKGMDMVGISPGESVLVIGLGNIGLSAVQLAGIYGAGKVIAADVREHRLIQAERYTRFLLNLTRGNSQKSLLDLNDGKQVDAAIECSGNPVAIDALADFVRPGGRIHLQGQYRKPIVITRYARWNCSDLRISCSIAMNAGDKEAILQLISEGKFDAKNLYSAEFPVDQAPEVYRSLSEKRYEVSKYIFTWG